LATETETAHRSAQAKLLSNNSKIIIIHARDVIFKDFTLVVSFKLVFLYPTPELFLRKKSMEFFTGNPGQPGYRNTNLRFRLSSRSIPSSLASCKAVL
jgi:hypothetical protein